MVTGEPLTVDLRKAVSVWARRSPVGRGYLRLATPNWFAMACTAVFAVGPTPIRVAEAGPVQLP
jgi:hypothetical protein